MQESNKFFYEAGVTAFSVKNALNMLLLQSKNKMYFKWTSVMLTKFY